MVPIELRELTPVHELLPAANFALLISLLVFILVRNNTWTGMHQEVRLAAVEKTVHNVLTRIDRLEANHHAISNEIQVSLVSLNHDIAARIDVLTRRLTKTDGLIQTLRTSGCGHPECPLLREIEKNTQR